MAGHARKALSGAEDVWALSLTLPRPCSARELEKGGDCSSRKRPASSAASCCEERKRRGDDEALARGCRSECCC